MSEKVDTAALLAASEDLRVEVRELACQVEALSESNETLSASDDAQRRSILALTVGGVVLAAVIAVVIYALTRIDAANDRLDRQAAYDVASCERGNAVRAAQRQQWLDVREALSRFKDPGTNRLAERLVANAHKNFPHLDCAAMTRGEEPQPVPLPLPTRAG